MAKTKINKATRDEVFYAIETEREYQDTLWNSETTTTDGIHSITEWLVFMEDYLLEAKHLVTRMADSIANPKALEIIRKITAMGVACMEQNGCTVRSRPDPRRVMEEHGIMLEA